MLTPALVGAKVDGGSPHLNFRPCLRRHHLVRRLLTRPVPRWICPPVSMERVWEPATAGGWPWDKVLLFLARGVLTTLP